MRTIEVQLFKFNELSDEAKQVAMNAYEADTSFSYNDAHESVKAFNEIFGTRESRDTWINVSTEHIDDCILELTGFRLQKYLWNNFRDGIYKPKQYSLWSKKDVSFKYYKDGYPVLKIRKSRVFLDDCCPLTGVCYDEDMLDPIREFLASRDVESQSTTFESLMEDCFYRLFKSLESEDEYAYSDEGKSEELSERDDEYTITGKAA